MIGCVPLHVPGPAVSVCPCCAVPAIVGGEVFAGGVGVKTPCTEIVSAMIPNACEAVSLPSWSVAMPAVPRLAVAVW